MKSFDVIIAGGAMAGGTLALALNQLSQQSLSIAVIEAYQPKGGAHPGFDSRAIALSYGTVNTLKRFGLWDDLHAVATPITHIHVSDRSHFGMTDIDHKEANLDALGYVIELADVGQIYQTKISQCEQITQYCPLSVTEVARDQESVSVTLSDGSQLQSKMLVAADGALSTCCEQLGLELDEHDFGQHAVIANVEVSQPHEGRAFERFTTHGPVALLPMSGQRMSLVWCQPPHQVDALLNCSDEQFLEQLQQAFGWRLGKMTRVGQRASYPLVLRTRSQVVSHRFAIVGNAAQTLHPIAGQGFNLGIRDVASLAEELTHGDALGSYQQLTRYKTRREHDRQMTIGLTSSLVHLFSNDLPTLSVGRNVGLALMDNCAQLKAPLLKRTLGIVNR